MTNMIWGPAGSATVIEGASFGIVSFPEGHEGSAAIDVTLTGQNALESGTCDSYSWRYAAIAQAIVEHNLNAADFEHVVIFQPPSGACRNPGAAGGTSPLCGVCMPVTCVCVCVCMCPSCRFGCQLPLLMLTCVPTNAGTTVPFLSFQVHGCTTLMEAPRLSHMSWGML